MSDTAETVPGRFNRERAAGDGRTVHDVGGLDFGPIDRDEHDLALWEKRVDAMMILLYAKKGAFKVDAMRRVIEGYRQQDYDQIGYYDKWIRALATLCVEQEIFSSAELDAAVAEARRSFEARRRG